MLYFTQNYSNQGARSGRGREKHQNGNNNATNIVISCRILKVLIKKVDVEALENVAIIHYISNSTSWAEDSSKLQGQIYLKMVKDKPFT